MRKTRMHNRSHHPTDRRSLRRAIAIGIILAFLSIGVWRVYREFVPAGASPTAYLGYSTDGGTIVSPSNQSYWIRFNDAGAMHSGHYWTWVIEYHLLTGRSINTEGYLGSEFAIDGKPIPVKWVDDQPVIAFRSSRYE